MSRPIALSLNTLAREITEFRTLAGVPWRKPYDFNFDVESKERVYCSKLVYLSYSGVEWPTKRSLGRTTFTPDDVAIKAAKDGTLQLVAFYHDGKRVDKNLLDTMSELMGVEKEKEKQAALGISP